MLAFSHTAGSIAGHSETGARKRQGDFIRGTEESIARYVELAFLSVSIDS